MSYRARQGACGTVTVSEDTTGGGGGGGGTNGDTGGDTGSGVNTELLLGGAALAGLGFVALRNRRNK